MTSIGQLMGRALIALWRRRLGVLGLMLAWLALDGLLLGYLSAYHPTYGLSLPRGAFDLLDLGWFGTIWFQIFLLLPQQFLHDVVRAVFVILLLRTLLAPAAGNAARGKVGFLVPFLLVLAFEMFWTMILFPLDHGIALAIVRAESDGLVDHQTIGVALPLVSASIFVCFAMAMCKLCFVYPHSALHGALRPGRSWRDTDGLAARLFLLFLAIAIPFTILRGLLTMLILRYDLIGETHQQVAYVLLLLDSVQEVPSAIVSLAVVCAAYVAATGHAADAIPATERSSRQLAEAFE